MCECNVNVFHHWSMHIETHPRLGRSHTRASTIDITLLIHNPFDVNMALQLFLTSYSMARDCYRSKRNVSDAYKESMITDQHISITAEYTQYS